MADSSRPALSRKICCRPELTRPCCPGATGATSRSCPELNALLPGSTVNFDFAHQRLVMTIPQALMTHRARIMFPLLCGTKVLAPFRVTIVIQAPASVPARAAPSAITI
ncbi:hypothetical protein KD913_18815 [Klebsiella pneumoniae]